MEQRINTFKDFDKETNELTCLNCSCSKKKECCKKYKKKGYHCKKCPKL
ncbi:MAG: hypothetical protein ACK479_00885 [Fluviicola sp.]